MNSGWVKLHRKALDNEILKRDHNAWRVFTILILLVDRKSGTWEGGRIQLGNHCTLKPITTYYATLRLAKAKMITLSSNNKYTTYSICNWEKYQAVDNSDDNNAITTAQQRDNNEITLLQEDKKLRRTRSEEKIYRGVEEVTLKDSDLQEIAKRYEVPVSMVELSLEEMENWMKAKGRTYRDRKAALRNWVIRSKKDVLTKSSAGKGGVLDARNL